MDYNVDYFINKFEAIPDCQWTVGQLTNNQGQYCALGHCSYTVKNGLTEESNALEKLIIAYYNTSVVAINDNLQRYPEGNFTSYGSTPKERILTALRQIKEGKVSIK